MTSTVQTIANTIVNSALEMAAKKAGVSVGVIASTIVAEPTGNVARYVAELIACGARNIDTIITAAREGRDVTAAELA